MPDINRTAATDPFWAFLRWWRNVFGASRLIEKEENKCLLEGGLMVEGAFCQSVEMAVIFLRNACFRRANWKREQPPS